MMRDGEVVTACQQTCPTQAITFGNLNDKNAAVDQAREPSRRTIRCSKNCRPSRERLICRDSPIPAETDEKQS